MSDLFEPEVLASLLRQWSRSLRARNRSPRTIETYTDSTRRLVEFAVAGGYGQFDRALVEDYLAEQTDRHKPATVAFRYRSLQQWCKWLAAEGELAADPMAGMSAPHVPEQPVPVLTDDQLRALLAACKGTAFPERRDTAIIRLFLDTGMRLGELTGLDVTDLDMELDGGRRGPRVVRPGPLACPAAAERQLDEVGLPRLLGPPDALGIRERALRVDLVLEPAQERLTRGSGALGAVRRAGPALVGGDARPQRPLLGCQLHVHVPQLDGRRCRAGSHPPDGRCVTPSPRNAWPPRGNGAWLTVVVKGNAAARFEARERGLRSDRCHDRRLPGRNSLREVAPMEDTTRAALADAATHAAGLAGALDDALGGSGDGTLGCPVGTSSQMTEGALPVITGRAGSMGIMLSATEQVWRHLLAGAHERDQRQWPSISALAADLDMPVSTTHRALERPGQIGAVDVSRAGGLVVRDPGKLLILWAGTRRLDRDVLDRFHVGAAAPEVEASATSAAAVLGGFGAVVARRGGNGVADYSTVLFYADPRLALEPCPAPRWPWEATEVIVLEPDPRLARYGRVTPIGQAWVDLFNLGGWQADRFVHHLLGELVNDGTQAKTVLSG